MALVTALLVFPVESGTIPVSHLGAFVTGVLDVRYTFMPLLPNLLSRSRLLRFRGCGGSLMVVRLISGCVFASWAPMSEGKNPSLVSSQTRGAVQSQYVYCEFRKMESYHNLRYIGEAQLSVSGA